MKLSKAQQEALDKLTDGWQSAYDMQVRLSTLYSLRGKGLVETQYNVGSFSSPRVCTMWRLAEVKESER